MIEVQPQTRTAIFGLVAIILAAGWAAYGLIGDSNQLFLTIMVVLTILLGAGAAVLVRARAPQQ